MIGIKPTLQGITQANALTLPTGRNAHSRGWGRESVAENKTFLLPHIHTIHSSPTLHTGENRRKGSKYTHMKPNKERVSSQQ